MEGILNYFIKVNEQIIKKIKFEIDKCSILSEDMVKFWNKRIKDDSFNKFEIKKLNYDEYISELVNDENINLTCDYIGPSIYISEAKRGLTIADILEYYIPSREFGGHMIWPSKEIQIRSNSTIKKSINTARSYCFKERIDYALFGIKKWYEETNKVKCVFTNVLEGNAGWLKQFRSFEGFIDFFMLNAFMDCKYNVYDLSSYSKGVYTAVIQEFPKVNFTTKEEYENNLIEAYIPENYLDYIIGCIGAIKNRSKNIGDYMA